MTKSISVVSSHWSVVSGQCSNVNLGLLPTASCLLPSAYSAFCLLLFRLSQNHLEAPSPILRRPSCRRDAVNIFDACIGAACEQHPHGRVLSIRRSPH